MILYVNSQYHKLLHSGYFYTQDIVTWSLVEYARVVTNGVATFCGTEVENYTGFISWWNQNTGILVFWIMMIKKGYIMFFMFIHFQLFITTM